MTLKEFLTSIADSIRKKTGETDQIPASEFSSRIEAIETGIDTTLSNGATSADIRVGKSSYANGEKIDGSMPDVEVTMGDISVSSSGLITATASLSGNGYIDTAPQPVTRQLVTQGGKTITPTTTSQTAIATGRYAIGTVTVAGDTNLQSQYIKDGVIIFGVKGSYSENNEPYISTQVLSSDTKSITVSPGFEPSMLCVICTALHDTDLHTNNILEFAYIDKNLTHPLVRSGVFDYDMLGYAYTEYSDNKGSAVWTSTSVTLSLPDNLCEGIVKIIVR